MDLDSDFQLLFNQQRYSEIIDKARSFGVNPGTQPVLSKYLAGAYFCVGDFLAAEALLIQLESSFSDDPNFLSLFAATSRRVSNYQRAEHLFSKALKLQPDSLQVRNNYANLLIDLSQFDKARSLLEAVLAIEPSYRDALDNLDRLDQLAEINRLNQDPSAGFVNSSNKLSFQDPLLFAFEKSEVDHSLNRYKLKPKSLSEKQNAIRNLPDPESHAVALEQLDAARQALQEKQFELVLKLCSQSFRILGPNSDVYDLVSDAYLNLNCYKEAETFLLHAMSIQGLSLKRCFNLVSFSMMRQDYALANFYLQKASEIDPSSSDLERLKILLKERTSAQHVIFRFPNPASA